MNCRVCGKKFYPPNKNYKICSEKCRKVNRKKAWKKWLKEHYPYKGNYYSKCVICGKEIDSSRSVGHGAKTCCEECGKILYKQTLKKWYKIDWETKKYNNRKRGKKYRDKYKALVLEHYGGKPPKCACCGETQYEFLCIDHIKGNGTKHLHSLNLRGTIYRWIIRNNFPKIFQILCFNCNMLKSNHKHQYCKVHHPELYQNI